MSLAKEIEDMEVRVAADKLGIEELRLLVQHATDQGIDAADGRKRLGQMQHVQQSREEMLNLARVFQAMSRDPRKG